ncbi:hypothetical protein [Mariniblastus fucicola]|uniref:Uncharacterized protein n=1 Tax=Mariniblastus fucicola TaxID=980251 RepID=A0A5B9P5E6_9BACT|nr:hypothetical protein [Mariniblastus fucicola]QEG21484.1 hypothetical protein MFFC18_13400 [Mariniblastus fucicola]
MLLAESLIKADENSIDRRNNREDFLLQLLEISSEISPEKNMKIVEQIYEQEDAILRADKLIRQSQEEFLANARKLESLDRNFDPIVDLYLVVMIAGTIVGTLGFWLWWYKTQRLLDRKLLHDTREL